MLKGLSRRKPKAMVFVDYEYWFYSYKTRFGLQPDPFAWRGEIEKQYSIVDIMVFADFSSPGLSTELGKLREVTNAIIETGTESNRRKKDMTDFVMLDYIYQMADSHKKIETYILFTGDGHFQSVIKYLIHKKKKRVVVYGVNDSFSKRLQTVASESIVIPFDDELYKIYRKMIIENMAYIADKPKIIPTFNGTAEAVASRNEVPLEQITATLARMIDEGLLVRKEQRVEFTKRVKVLAADWSLLIQQGLWTPDK